MFFQKHTYVFSGTPCVFPYALCLRQIPLRSRSMATPFLSEICGRRGTGMAEKDYFCIMVPKSLLLCCACLALSLPLRGQALRSRALSSEEARLRAVDALAPLLPPSAALTPATAALPPATQRLLDEARAFAFTLSDGGLVIASGDARCVPLLAYVPESQALADSLPPALQTWLRLYAEELAWADSVGYGATDTDTAAAAATAAATSERADVDYLVLAEWNQGSPYYNDCVFANTYCYTGCVATAMAQIMYYWATSGGYAHGCTALDAYTTSSKGYSVGALDEIEAFAWDDMLTTYSSSSSSTAKEAVAELMRYCGQSVEMDYSSSGSGASSSDVVPAFENCFGYEATAHLVDRSSMTAAAWDSLIYTELQAGRPVYMNGVDGDELVGHAFVCDGYQASTGLYHFNWGWSGTYNGYFALEALTPGGTGAGGTSSAYGDYSVARGAVVELQPPTGETHTLQSYDLLVCQSLYLLADTAQTRDDRTDDIEPVSLTSVIFNQTGETVTVSYDYGLFDSGGDFLYAFGQGGTSSVGASMGGYFTATLALAGQLPYGDYFIRPIVCQSGTSDWLPMDGSDHHFVRLHIADGSISLQPSFAVATTLLSEALDDGTYDNRLRMENVGAEELSTTLVLLADGSVTQYFESYASPGEADTLALTYSGDPDEAFLVVSDLYSACYPFISDSSYAYVDWDMAWDGYVDSKNRLYADTYDARLILCNRSDYTYTHDAVLYLYPYGSTVSSAQSVTLSISLPPHSEGSFPFSFDDVDAGTTYELRLSLYEGNGTTNYQLSQYGCALTLTRGTVIGSPDGITYTPDTRSVSVPDDAYFVDLRFTDNLTSISPGDGASTLYILPSLAPRLTSYNSLNTVRGSTASSLTLDAADGLCTPLDFTATTATLTATLASAGEWQPLVVPFAASVPEGLTVETLASVGGDTLYFAETDTVPAYTPLLVKGETAGDYVFSASAAIIRSDTLAMSRCGDIDLFALTATDSVPMAYALDDDCEQFSFAAQPTAIPAYGLYAIAYDEASDGRTLFVAHGSETADGIISVAAETAAGDSRVFSLSGMQLPDARGLAPGLYVIGGRKVLITK